MSGDFRHARTVGGLDHVESKTEALYKELQRRVQVSARQDECGGARVAGMEVGRA